MKLTLRQISRLGAVSGLALVALWPIATASKQSEAPHVAAADGRVAAVVIDHIAEPTTPGDATR